MVKITRKGGVFEVWTKEGANITAYAIIIATGVKQSPVVSTNFEGIFVCADADEGVKVSFSAKKYLEDLGIK